MSNRPCREGRGFQTTALLLLTASVKGHPLDGERAPRHHVPAASGGLHESVYFSRPSIQQMLPRFTGGWPAGSGQPGASSRSQKRWPRQYSPALAPPKATPSLPLGRRCPGLPELPTVLPSWRSPQPWACHLWKPILPTVRSGGACQARCSPPDLWNLLHSYPLRQASQGALGEVLGRQLSLLTWRPCLLSHFFQKIKNADV